jgi:hypothetical protein
MLATDDENDATSAIVQSFWSRAAELSTRQAMCPAKVVDLAAWVRLHRLTGRP